MDVREHLWGVSLMAAVTAAALWLGNAALAGTFAAGAAIELGFAAYLVLRARAQPR